MKSQNDKKNSVISGTITFFLLAIAIVICAFVGLNPPDPPIPEEGVEVNLGDSDFGMGNATEPDATDNMQPEAPASPTVGEQVSTQNTEQTVAMNTTNNNSKVERKAETKPKDPQPNPQPSKNTNALYPGKKTTNNGGSQGVTPGNGNQGKPGGDPTSNRYDGVPGNGGVGWSLNGRRAVNVPTPSNNNIKEGKIIVKIWVDQEGTVTKAEAPVKGSTITETAMVNKAKAAAMNAKFNADPNATELQIGTITYVYRSNN